MKNKKVPGGAVAGSVVISLLIAVMLAYTAFIFVVNRIFTENFIRETISNVRIEQIEIPITVDGKTYNNISEVVVDKLNENNEDVQVTDEDVQKFFDESGIDDILSEKLNMGLDAIMNGEEATLLTKQEIMDFVEENEELVEETLKVEITEEHKAKLEEELEENDIEEVFTTKTITNTIYETELNPIAVVIKGFRTFFSVGMIVGGYIVVVLLWVGIFFLNKRQAWYAGPYFGIPAIVVGAEISVTALTVKIIGNIIAKDVEKYIKPELFTSLAMLLLIVGLIHLVVGIAVTVVSFTVKKNLRKKETEEAEMTCYT